MLSADSAKLSLAFVSGVAVAAACYHISGKIQKKPEGGNSARTGRRTSLVDNPLPPVRHETLLPSDEALNQGAQSLNIRVQAEDEERSSRQTRDAAATKSAVSLGTQVVAIVESQAQAAQSTPDLPSPHSNMSSANSTPTLVGRSSGSKHKQSLGAYDDLEDVGLHLEGIVDEKMVERSLKDRRRPVFRFVLTGGPCAGKTTALARLTTYLRQRGFRVFTVPEAATILFTNGATFNDLDTKDKLITFQGNLLLTQTHLEDTFANIASNCDQPCILLCDRGTMDGSAYIDPEVWNELLQRYSFDKVTLRDGRYNAVFHLVTAANGALPYYTLANNAIRTETPEEARRLDLRLQEAWIGHPKLVVIDNSTDFEGKLERLVARLSAMIGLPTTRKKFRKFVLRSPFSTSSIPPAVKFETFEVEKVYLRMNNDRATLGKYADYRFVRRRAQGALCAYGETAVRFNVDGQKIERKRIIRSREYKSAINTMADPSRRVVRQIRHSFLWESHYYEIYVYETPRNGLCILNTQVDDEKDTPLPPFINLVKEVTGDEQYSAYFVSLKSQQSPAMSKLKSPEFDLQEFDLDAAR